MTALPQIVREAWTRREGPVVLATVSADGVPNVIYVTCVGTFGDDRIVIADNYFEKTRRNILGGGRGALLFMTKDGKAYQVGGTLEYHRDGEVFESMKGWNPPKHPGHAAAALRVDAAYTGQKNWRDAEGAMKDRDVEIRERALALLGVASIYDTEQIKRNFRRQIRLVNPDLPGNGGGNVPGFDNTEVARLLIQAYGHLTGRKGPITMIENDALVGTLLNGWITPIAQTTTYEQWHATQFYDQFLNGNWPDSPELDQEMKYKFKGIC